MTDDVPTEEPIEEPIEEPGAVAAPGAVVAAGPSTVRVVLAVLVVVALVAVTAAAVLQRGRIDDLEDDLRRRTEVATAAATFGEVHFSINDRWEERVTDLASPDYAADFEATRAESVKETLADLGTTTEATATEVFVGDLTDDSARALVVVDIVASSAAAGSETLRNLTFVLDLVRIDGRWLTDKVNPSPQLSVDGVGSQPPDTSTTAP